MQTNQQPDRAINYQIREALLNAIYSKSTMQYQAKLDALIAAHAESTQSLCYAFKYKGAIYPEHAVLLGRTLFNLEPRYEPVLLELLQEKAVIEQDEQLWITAYLTAALNIAGRSVDLLLLLPECLHEPATVLCSKSYRVPTVTPALVQAFKDKHAKPISLIKRRLIINLIT